MQIARFHGPHHPGNSMGVSLLWGDDVEPTPTELSGDLALYDAMLGTMQEPAETRTLLLVVADPDGNNPFRHTFSFPTVLDLGRQFEYLLTGSVGVADLLDRAIPRTLRSLLNIDMAPYISNPTELVASFDGVQAPAEEVPGVPTECTLSHATVSLPGHTVRIDNRDGPLETIRVVLDTAASIHAGDDDSFDIVLDGLTQRGRP